MEFTLHGSCINNLCSSDRDGQVTDSVTARFSAGDAWLRLLVSDCQCPSWSVGRCLPCVVPATDILTLLHLSSKIKSTVGVPVRGYMCRFMCKARWSDLEKALSQRWHWKGRWPVCLR